MQPLNSICICINKNNDYFAMDSVSKVVSKVQVISDSIVGCLSICSNVEKNELINMKYSTLVKLNSE